jgi:hypothetical protein
MPVADDIQELRDRDDIDEIKSTVLEYPNIKSAGVGYRYQDDERTDEPAIIASAYPKKSESELEGGEVVPEEIDGVPIDVYELEREPTEERADSRGSELRPIPGGAQFTATGTIGTLGMPVTDTDSDTDLLLTAAHTPYDEDEHDTIDDLIGETVYQPSTSEENEVGAVYDAEYDELDDSEQDWAAIEFDDSDWITNEILGVGMMGEYREPSFDQPLVFSGRSSSGNGIRKTELVAIDVYSTGGRGPSLEYADTTESGDSGSAVGQFDSDGKFRPAALHFAGGSYGLMLDNILEERRSDYELITDEDSHDVPDYTDSGPYFEAAVGVEDHRRSTVKASVWNGGGEYGTTYVETLDEDSKIVDSKTVGIDSMDWRLVELDIPRSGDYQLKTRDIEQPHDDSGTESTVEDVDEYGPGTYIVDDGELVKVD